MEFPIFQVSLKHYSIRNWEEKKKPLLDKIPTGDYTDFMAYQRDLAVPPYLDELSDCVEEEIVDFQQSYPCPVVITNAWTETARQYDYHPVHQHGATGFSAVLYLKFSPQCHEATKFYSPFNDPATGDLLEFQPFVKEGDLIIFPSYLLHEGPMNKSEVERTIVSFNIMGEDSFNAYNAGTQR